jgi:hypothetical protein
MIGRAGPFGPKMRRKPVICLPEQSDIESVELPENRARFGPHEEIL